MNGRQASSRAGRILVVDDEPSIVDAVATALRYEGFDVEEAATGRDALAGVRRGDPGPGVPGSMASPPAGVRRADPDLVVLDWMLPDLEGIEVGRRLREQGFGCAILFLTAKDAIE